MSDMLANCVIETRKTEIRDVEFKAALTPLGGVVISKKGPSQCDVNRKKRKNKKLHRMRIPKEMVNILIHKFNVFEAWKPTGNKIYRN